MERPKSCIGGIASRPCKERKNGARGFGLGSEIKNAERVGHPPAVITQYFFSKVFVANA